MDISLSVRLPGQTTPTEIFVPSDSTGRQVVEEIRKKFTLEGIKNSCLVAAPNSKKPGTTIDNEVIICRAPYEDFDLLELWNCPYTAKFFVFSSYGSKEASLKGSVLVDWSSPLSDQIPALAEYIKPLKKGFILQHLPPLGAQPKFLSIKSSLEAQGVQQDGHLMFYPLEAMKKAAFSKSNLEGEGWLIRHGKKDKSKMMKKTFFVKEDQLWYYDNPANSLADGVIPLDFYLLGRDGTTISLSPFSESLFSNPHTYRLFGDEYSKTEALYQLLKHKTSDSVKVFGIPLEDLVDRKDSNVPGVPRIVVDLIRFLDKNGLKEEGIFRVSPSLSCVEVYKYIFDRGYAICLDQVENVHLITSLLKTFLRDLPEPLLTWSSYNKMIDIFNQCWNKEKSEFSHSKCAELLPALLITIPWANISTLRFLACFLGRVIFHSNDNKMSAQNLATVFGINFVRSKDELTDTLKGNEMVTPVIHTLIASSIDILANVPFSTEDPKKANLTKTTAAEPGYNTFMSINSRSALASSLSIQTNNIISKPPTTTPPSSPRGKVVVPVPVNTPSGQLYKALPTIPASPKKVAVVDNTQKTSVSSSHLVNKTITTSPSGNAPRSVSPTQFARSPVATPGESASLSGSSPALSSYTPPSPSTISSPPPSVPSATKSKAAPILPPRSQKPLGSPSSENLPSSPRNELKSSSSPAVNSDLSLQDQVNELKHLLENEIRARAELQDQLVLVMRRVEALEKASAT